MPINFKKSYKHNKTHHNHTNSHHPSTSHYNATHLDKHKLKSHNTNDQVNEIIGQTHASKTTNAEPEDTKDPHALHQTPNNYHKVMKLLKSS